MLFHALGCDMAHKTISRWDLHPGTSQPNNIIWCHFCPFQALIQGSRGPKYGYFWVKIRPLWRAVSRSYRPAWKVSGAPYYTPMHVTTLLRATFALSRHPSRVPRVQNMATFGVKIRPLWFNEQYWTPMRGITLPFWMVDA